MKEEQTTGFYLTFENGILFKQLIDLCKEILTDINLEILEDGIHMQSMDMSHVSLINFFLSKESFKYYHVSSPTTIALSLKSLSTVLKCYKNEFDLSFSSKDNNTDVLDIIMLRKMTTDTKTLENNKQQQYTFSLNLMSIDQEYLSIPNEDAHCTIIMEASDFCDCIKNISSIGNDLELKTVGKLVEFNVIGDIGKVSMCETFSKKNMTFTKMDNYTLRLSMRYLQTFCKGNFFSKMVELRIREEQPLQMRYEIENGSFLEFYLAPKFDD